MRNDLAYIHADQNVYLFGCELIYHSFYVISLFVYMIDYAIIVCLEILNYQ